MKTKNNYLTWCVLFIFLMLPFQFACNEENELQQEQTAITDFDPWAYDLNCNEQIDADEIQIVLNDFTENNITEAEFKAFFNLWKSLNTGQEENSEKADFDPCIYDVNPTDKFIGTLEYQTAIADWLADKITTTQLQEVLHYWLDDIPCNGNNAEYYYSSYSENENVPWDIKYKADALPASPWENIGGEGSISNGILHLIAPRKYDYDINFTTGTAEFKLRIGSGNAIVRLYNNNNKFAKFTVANNHICLEVGSNQTISGLDNSSDFHTYRVTLADTEVKVYRDGVLMIEDEAGNSNSRNSIDFYQEIQNGNSYWDYFYFTNNGAYKPVPPVLAKGDGWVLVHNDPDYPDYDENTINDQLMWACKGVVKYNVLNYYVKEKLLGSNIVKFLAKNPPGVTALFKYYLFNLNHVGGVDCHTEQVFVREIDGFTKTIDEGDRYNVDGNYGYFQTATLVHKGYSSAANFTLELCRLESGASFNERIIYATAVLPYNNRTNSSMVIWDKRLHLDTKLDLLCVCVFRNGTYVGKNDIFRQF